MGKVIRFCCRSQTTKGIWIAKCVGIEPSTIAMDLEGTDGRERGEVINFSSISYYVKVELIKQMELCIARKVACLVCCSSYRLSGSVWQ